MRPPLISLLVVLTLGAPPPTSADDQPPQTTDVFRRDNLVAWCIVPFDARRRGPEERAAMLERLGVRRLAYDYRAEHIPTFDAEVEALRRHHIELTAWWFPTTLNDEARQILAVLERHGLKTQLWVTGGGEPTRTPEEQRERVVGEAARLRPIAEAAAKIGCRVELYNHGGWFGEPENQLEIIQELGLPNVGIVYNLHHGHPHLDRFPELLKRMLPYLDALNLNGMVRGGDAQGKKILPLGEGELDADLLRTIRESGYRGPIGILNHTDNDAEARLQDNLDGLAWLLPQLAGAAPGPRPKWRTWQAPPAPVAQALDGGKLLPGKDAYRRPPLTVEVRATLTRKDQYNILVASDTKQSGAHWELFTENGNGNLTLYVPGMRPDHVRSSAMVCDGQPHQLALLYEPARARLLVDGRVVADQRLESAGRDAVPGGLGLGRLVEGGLTCSGAIHWVRLSSGLREIPTPAPDDAERDERTLDLWVFPGEAPQGADNHPAGHATQGLAGAGSPLPYDAALAERLANDAARSGRAGQGAALFADAKLACLSCHKIGRHGGAVGPELTKIGTARKPHQLAESLLWPQHEVCPEFMTIAVQTEDGESHRGYKVQEDERTLTLRDPSTGNLLELAKEGLTGRREAGSLMPAELATTMSREQQQDLVRFLADLGRGEQLPVEQLDALLARASHHVPVPFEWTREPLHPEQWPSWQAPVNRDRVYDYYAKQADHFRLSAVRPPLLAEFPGLDGGKLGHWGNQNEETWADGRWNGADLGRLQCGVFRGADVTVPRGVCVRLGDRGELSTCFNPETLTYDAVWSGGFVEFSSVRHGFMHGLLLQGTPQERPQGAAPTEPFLYHGFYRHGDRVLFSYRVGDVEWLDSPWVEQGKFVRVVARADEHPLRELTRGGPPQWPQSIETKLTWGTGRPYAVDTIGLPVENPWKALLFCGGHGFLPNGDGLVCTMHGDVWRVTGLDAQRPADGGASRVTWRRVAAGLHHLQGLVVGDDGVFVQGRDQLTRLHDLNGDGETDFYECFSGAFATSPAGHDFICGLERDEQGRFYTASGNEGLVRIAADGRSVEVLATGFRNPDGLGLAPETASAGDHASPGIITVPCSEGDWTPSSMICAVRRTPLSPGDPPPVAGGHAPPFYGWRGKGNAPPPGAAPDLPLVYLPRGLDNSSGGQVYVSSDRWGPLRGQMVHLSFGAGAHFLLLRDEVQGQLQGGVVPLPGEFRSGAHRGRFHPLDGQLYVSGMAGWGSYTPDDGSFQRVRYTGDPVRLPVGFHPHENGVLLRFSAPLDSSAADAAQHFAQCWNYRYSSGYGSAELSPSHPGLPGHDVLRIASATLLDQGRSLFLELPELQPVNQLHLRLRVAPDEPVDLFLTVHRLDAPRTDLPGVRHEPKTIAAHPIFADLLWETQRRPNPFVARIRDARPIRLEAGKNLSYVTRVLRAHAGESIALTFDNPDVVPHNWALVRPGALQQVGELSNKLVADPEAVLRHYIPESPDVICHTDVVPPGGSFTIYFKAPETPGRYPYLCTFPGHWMVMNGELIVE